jgi:phage/conjugal plasmid C-4 type zinc finger TraR family protein
MDIADIAQHYTEQLDELRRIERAARPAYTAGDSADDCMVCGTQIPSERQIAVPGVDMCVDCANMAEVKTRRSK